MSAKNLEKTISKLLANAKQDSILVMFCKELEVSDNQKELDYFCNNRCEFHKTPFELYCLPYSAKTKLASLHGGLSK